MDGDNLAALRNALAAYMAKAGSGRMMSPKAGAYMGQLNERIGNYDQAVEEAEGADVPEGGDMDMQQKELLMQELMRRQQQQGQGSVMQGGGMPVDQGYRPQRR